jgi:hypothetical protein
MGGMPVPDLSGFPRTNGVRSGHGDDAGIGPLEASKLGIPFSFDRSPLANGPSPSR